MAVPKHKPSKSRQRKRRIHQSLKMPDIPSFRKARGGGARSERFFCSNCNQVKPPHAVCPNCGYYRGRPVIEVER